MGTPNNFSAAGVDQMPQLYVAQQMFGSPTLPSIPDVERTEYVLILCANLVVSNGSVMSSPGACARC